MSQTPMRCFAFVLATGIVWSGHATAAGFELLEQSAVAQGAAYAGAGARADDPSTIFYNPAGITKLPGIQVSAGLAGIFPQGTLLSGTATTAGYLGGVPYSGVTGTNAGVNKLLPTFYATAQFTDSLFGGVAVTSPFGLTTKYPPDSIARYYALTSELQTVNVAPTIGWQVLPQLSLGGGINIEFADAHLSNAVDYGSLGALNGLAPLGFGPGLADGSTTLRGSDTAVGWNIGALYEPRPGTRIGLAYRSAIFHVISGSLDYYGVPAPFAGVAASTNATAKLPEPSSASLSLAQDFGRWTALGSLTYTGWSIFHDLVAYSGTNPVSSTPENYRNTITISLGADYRVNDKLTLRGGTMFDQTPVQAQYRTPQLPDSNRYWLSIGATYRPIPNLALTGAYSHIFTPNSTVDLVDAGPGTPNFLRGDLSALYSLSIDIVSLQASYRF